MADWAIKPFRASLAEGGFVEGRNLTVIYRSAEGQFDRLPALAAELVKSQVSIIFATGSPVPARSAKAATPTIPIVFAYGGDPVSDGLVASFNRPGGNVTGATFIGTALTAKRMGLLRDILPHVSDVALLVNPKGTLAEGQIAEAKAAAQALGLTLHIVNATSESGFDEAFATMSRLKVGAFFPSTDPLFGLSGRGLASQWPTVTEFRQSATGAWTPLLAALRATVPTYRTHGDRQAFMSDASLRVNSLPNFRLCSPPSSSW
jgi:putative ABC transport system substrate-binding protein